MENEPGLGEAGVEAVELGAEAERIPPATPVGVSRALLSAVAARLASERRPVWGAAFIPGMLISALLR